MKKAVIDRIIDGAQAVLLVGEDETEKVVSFNDLPSGAGEGMWLLLHPDGTIEIDLKETNKVMSRIKDKMALLP